MSEYETEHVPALSVHWPLVRENTPVELLELKLTEPVTVALQTVVEAMRVESGGTGQSSRPQTLG